MSHDIIIALIVSMPPTIAATGAIIASLHSVNKIEAVRVHINSRMDQLLKAENAQGRQDERDSHSVTVPGVPLEPK